MLTALGGSVATPAEGLTAELIVVRNFDELKTLGREKVAGKIVLFNYPFDKQMAAERSRRGCLRRSGRLSGDGPSAAARLGAVACLDPLCRRRGLSIAAHWTDDYATDAPKIPAGAVTAEDADLIAALVPQGSFRMHLLLTPKHCLMRSVTTLLAI